jgi:predicted alpha/beta superfamily hydrolase
MFKGIFLFMTLFITNCQALPASSTTKTHRPKTQGVIGRLDIFDNVKSRELGNSRTVRVWLPPDYSTRKNDRFPVIYFHDGANGFDEVTSGGMGEWGLDETMTALIAEGKARSAIIVGVDCTDNRWYEYDYSLSGAKYGRFLIETVKPMIDRKYRTIQGPEGTFTMGSSMGGHIALELAWYHPEVFSAAAALSLPAGVNDGSLFKMLTAPPPGAPVRLYADRGTLGLDSYFAEDDDEFVAQFKKNGFAGNALVYDIYDGADHLEPDWANRVHVPLEWLLPPL